MGILDDASALWQPEVTLGGADVSARLTGAITVRREEDAATLATFRLLLEAGAIDPTAWVGAAVQIQFVRVDAAGAELGRWAMFRGRVNVPAYDPETAEATYQCSDGLQEAVDATDRAALDTLIGGYWSADLYPEADTAWDYAQQRLETVPKHLDLAPDGVTLRATAWAAGAPADTLTEADLLDAAPLEVSLARRDQLTNQVSIAADLRLERLRHREHAWAWSYGRTFCEYLIDSTTLPNLHMARAAAEGTGWALKSESYTRLDPTGTYSCGDPPTDVNWVNYYPELITACSLTFVRRWTQTVTEHYALTVSAPESSGQVGVVEVERRAAITIDYDWEAAELLGPEPEDDADGCGAVEARGSTLVASGVTVTGATARYAPPAGSTQDAWGDWVLDQIDETRRLAALNTLLASAQTEILASHRRNRVTCTTVLRPDLDLVHTVRLNTARLQATGKLIQIGHRLSIDDGAAETTLTLAVSRRYGAATTPDALTPPARPDTTPDTGTQDQTWLGTAKSTQLGGKLTSPTYDPCQDGYAGNYTVVEGGSEIYPERVRVTVDAIEDAVRNEAEGTATAAYAIAIPEDELVMVAP